MDADVSVITLSSDTLGSLGYHTELRLRNVFDGVVLGYKECQDLLLRADIYEALRM